MKELDIIQMAPDELTPYKKNAKKHDAKQIANVARSIQENGWQQPIVCDKDHVVVIGHCRLAAAKKLGLTQVPVHIADDLNEKQIRKLRILDNKTNESEWDLELLLDDIKDLDFTDYDLDLPAFGEEDGKEAEEDGYEPEIPKTPKSKLGDIYLLGRHKVMCGDSTNPLDVKRLLAGRQADLLLTDPPYNVGLGEHSATGANRRTDRPKQNDGAFLLNDNMENGAFIQFLTKAFINGRDALRPGGAFYIWHASNNSMAFLQALENAELQMRQNLIWVKNAFTLGRQDYQWQHEPCIYGWRDGAAHYFIDDRKQCTIFEDQPPDIKHMKKEELVKLLEEVYSDKVSTTIIHEDKPSVSDLHPTMKPIKLMGRQIKNSTKPGDLVLDLFGGSGSTMMACEQLDRDCCSMEFDPHYCDVIVDRWQEFTGQEAVLLNDQG